MAQTLITFILQAGDQRKVFEKPHSLRRIFWGITVLAGNDVWRQTRISFDDPSFYSYYALDGQHKHFEMKGDGISQGDIWVYNASGISLLYTSIEILV